jgi:hypothetical protein
MKETLAKKTRVPAGPLNLMGKLDSEYIDFRFEHPHRPILRGMPEVKLLSLTSYTNACVRVPVLDVAGKMCENTEGDTDACVSLQQSQDTKCNIANA